MQGVVHSIQHIPSVAVELPILLNGQSIDVALPIQRIITNN